MAVARRPEFGNGRTLSGTDTIFALSSGAPPAAIAIIRISGPAAFAAASALVGELPPPRVASLRSLYAPDGRMLDRALILVFPAAASATGEDVVELQCHGGRAVVAAIDVVLAGMTGLRRATGGEFTRRALLNGRIDLAQAEALGDLLRAETERERVAAIAGIEGETSRLVAGWQDRLVTLSAQVEAAIDYDEDGDVAANAMSIARIQADMATLRAEMTAVATAPTIERLRDGVRVVLAGPRNAGKSTLFNLLADRDAAIVSPIAGTTRDRIEAPVQRRGVSYVLIDTAGLGETDDPVEAIGIARAEAVAATADIVLWMGDTPPPMANALWVWSRTDLPDRSVAPAGSLPTHRDDLASRMSLWTQIETCASMVIGAGSGRVNDRQAERIAAAAAELVPADDVLRLSEHLRRAHRTLSDISAATMVDTLLDRLFASFCVGK